MPLLQYARKLPPALAGLVVVSVVAAGCGTRVEDSAILSAEAGPSAAPATVGAVAAGGPAVAAGPAAAVGTAGQAPTAGLATSPVNAPAAGTNAAGLNGAAGAGAAGAGAAGSGAAEGSGSRAAGTSTGATKSAGGAGAPCAAKLAPVVVGQTGAFSGVVGAAIGHLRTGLSVWAKAVNARGGIQCHPVVVYQMDDGADPSRTDSNFKDLVLSKGAVALLGSGEPVQTAALQAAADRYKIPIVGGDGSNDEWWQSAYMFPLGGYILSQWSGAMKYAAQTTKARKVGIIYCVEANICSSLGKKGKDVAGKAGLELVSVQAASLTQSDFTSQCQNLKTAGANIVFIALDGSSVQRAMRNCKQIGLTIPVVLPSIAINQQAAADPNIRAVTGVLGTSVLPFTDETTAAGKEFHQNFNTYAPGTPIDDASMRGYVSGKLLEKALANVFSEARSGPITNVLIYKGLHQMKDETLSGFASPMTFPSDKPAPMSDCYFVLALGNDGFTAPLGPKHQCL
jgi:branched-chain amino acid transport system substrate-binding protein